jgi:hypothetical protein
MPAPVARFNYFLNASWNFSQDFKNIYMHWSLVEGRVSTSPRLLTRAMFGMKKMIRSIPVV